MKILNTYNMLRTIRKHRFIGLLAILFPSCNYLDVVPDNIATIDMAFNMRSEAEKYLYTCYAYMPSDGDAGTDPAILAGDEMWTLDVSPYYFDINPFRIALGFQSANAPLVDGNWVSLYQGLRDCNIFLENVGRVPDLPEWERKQWIAEAIFLKAYYHSYLLRMFGPIPLIRENLPISASEDEVKVLRSPADECFEYIISLIDEAFPELPPIVTNPARELGRITQPIAAAWKAKVLVMAASPLFNGNQDQATLKNIDGTPLFNSAYDPAKWKRAMDACKEAIDICHQVGMALYEYKPVFQQYTLSDTTVRELNIRNSVCEKWNSEIIWANTQTGRSANQTLQRQSMAKLKKEFINDYQMRHRLQPPLKIAEMYYTEHGVPIEEDESWKDKNLYALRKGDTINWLHIKLDYTTIELHFNREPRFYAHLGFDGGIWYGQGIYTNTPTTLYWVGCRMDGNQRNMGATGGPVTGYFWKKCVHYETVQPTENGFTNQYYPWPIMRLADLYLLYAETINEVEGPNGANKTELFSYIDAVRARAGLLGVQDAWNLYANNTKYNNQSGMREIIHRERLIELAFESQRYWDIRRWKTAPDYYSRMIEGWKMNEATPERFYTVTPLYEQTFGIKNYFWPIRESYIENNRNLVQNIGW